MPSMYALQDEEQYIPELPPAPIPMPDGSVYAPPADTGSTSISPQVNNTSEFALSPSEYRDPLRGGETIPYSPPPAEPYVPPGAAEAPDSASLPPASSPSFSDVSNAELPAYGMGASPGWTNAVAPSQAPILGPPIPAGLEAPSAPAKPPLASPGPSFSDVNNAELPAYGMGASPGWGFALPSSPGLDQAAQAIGGAAQGVWTGLTTPKKGVSSGGMNMPPILGPPIPPGLSSSEPAQDPMLDFWNYWQTAGRIPQDTRPFWEKDIPVISEGLRGWADALNVNDWGLPLAATRDAIGRANEGSTEERRDGIGQWFNERGLWGTGGPDAITAPGTVDPVYDTIWAAEEPGKERIVVDPQVGNPLEWAGGVKDAITNPRQANTTRQGTSNPRNITPPPPSRSRAPIGPNWAIPAASSAAPVSPSSTSPSYPALFNMANTAAGNSLWQQARMRATPEDRKLMDWGVLYGNGELSDVFFEESSDPNGEGGQAITVDDDGNYVFTDNPRNGKHAGEKVTTEAVRDIVFNGGQNAGEKQETQADDALSGDGTTLDQPVETTPQKVDSSSPSSSSGGSGGGSSGGGGRDWVDYGSNGGGGGGSRSSRSRRSSGGSFGDDSDFGSWEDYLLDDDGDGKFSEREKRAARRRFSKAGKMGRGGRVKGRKAPFPTGGTTETRDYILRELTANLGRPIGGWPEAMQTIGRGKR